MRAVLLDTSAYSAMYRGDLSIISIMDKADLVVVSPILVAELSIGFLAGSRKKENFYYLDDFLNDTGVTFVDIDLDTADRYALISQTLRQQGTPVPTNDIWLAALGWQHGYEILTLDSHFKNIPQAALIQMPS